HRAVLGHSREQSNAASYAGACEPNAEPTYEAPRAASSNRGVNRPADGRDVGGRIEIFERLEALHQGSYLGYLGATVSLPPHPTPHPPELPTSTTVNIFYSNWQAPLSRNLVGPLPWVVGSLTHAFGQQTRLAPRKQKRHSRRD